MATTTTTRRAKRIASAMTDANNDGPFEHSKLSSVTKANYELALRLFKEYAGGIKDNDSILKMEPKVLKSWCSISST